MDFADRAGSARTLESFLVDLLPSHPRPSSGLSATHTVKAPKFVDDASRVGLSFVHDNGHRRRNPPPPEAMCGGVALLDYDGDGWLDLYVVQGGPFPPLAPDAFLPLDMASSQSIRGD